MAKATKRKTGKSKKELLDEAIAQAVGAGRELHLETVDFSDPNRPKTCLEVDFPILPINVIAEIEGKGSGALKPIYQTMKWWARRRSTVFRQLLISAATKAPKEVTDAARLAWSSYYGNHQKNPNFRKLTVADVFMGGGTTIVEGARLGMQMYGNDLNPVAWFVVKNELAQVDPNEVKKLLDHIEGEVKPQIMPFYACDCPRGHKGKWKKADEIMGEGFDPLALKPEERPECQYEGPEVIYTFWVKHGPCQATECNHRTPIMTSPVVAAKTLSLRAWTGRECTKCKKTFSVERHEARMAPGALFVVAPDEEPYAVMDDDGTYACPHCAHNYHDEAAALNGQSAALGRAKNKSIELTLFVHPDWIARSSGRDARGGVLGGSVTDDAHSTAAWNEERTTALKLIEVRGPLPQEVVCPDTGVAFSTGQRGGTVPKRSTFTCREATCGLHQDVLSSVRKYGKPAPIAAYVIQGYCPTCAKSDLPLDGKFFAPSRQSSANAAITEWEKRRTGDLADYWPKSTIQVGDEIGDHDVNWHHFTNWWMMFNPRQLLVHALILRAIVDSNHFSWESKEQAIGVFQQYLRNQNLFCFWNAQRALEPLFSDNHFHPKNTAIENSVFSGLARGDFRSCGEKLVEAIEWAKRPWEISSPDGGHSHKVFTCDPLSSHPHLECGTATALNSLQSESVDLVITDPPFGGLIQYAELSDFFYVWIRLLLKERYPKQFASEYTPKILEAVTNMSRHPQDPDRFYQQVLTEGWKEVLRILKPGGILAFTFHHSEDEPWVAVLESLFDAGFYLEATYPVRSDETKGDGQFGSQKIEFDIIHVCRKRIEEPTEISWARLRRQIMQDVGELREILQQHQTAGLQEADIQVIRRGKALEYYSKHYGKVYVEKGREFTVREALAGINTLLDDERDTTSEMPPVLAEPYTRQFLRLFADDNDLPRDQMQKYLRGTGVSPVEFVDRGWCSESQKVFHITSPVDLAKKWKGAPRTGMGRDFDQAMFLIGACYENSGIRVQDTLDSPNFTPHPATSDLLGWFVRHGGDGDIKNAARLAKQLYDGWVAKNEKKVVAQRTLFDLGEEDA